MSVDHTLFLGPYAVWEVPKKSRPLSETPLQESLFDSGALQTNGGMDGIPEVKRGRKTVLQYVIMPGKEREGMPARQMAFGTGFGGVGTLDLTGIDTKSEIAQFARAFADELEELAGFFGGAPDLRWGVVEWLS